MSDQHQFQRTISDDGLVRLPEIDREGGAWSAEMPAALGKALASLPQLAPEEAEQILEPLLADHADGPEVWWGLAVAMVGEADMHNASTCYENFRDRVEIETALALQECSADPLVARRRLRRLAPSLVRCQDDLLAVRGLIMASGLELMFAGTAEASPFLQEVYRRIRSIWPRPWALVAEWLATIAIATAEQREGRRPQRTLRLALRFARHEPENRERIAAIGRDLGLLLNQADRFAQAESIYDAAMATAEGGATVETRASIAIAQAANLQCQRRYLEAFARLEYALGNELPDRLRALALLASADLMSRLGSAHRDRTQIEAAARAAAESATLLERVGLDPSPAIRDLGVAQALLGEVADAKRTLFTLLRAQRPHQLSPSERVALAYLAYLIRMSAGSTRKALGWAEYRLRTAILADMDRPRDITLLREHCIAAAERLGDIVTVRRHALAMLGAEASMLRLALGEGRGPADWNRLRIAREGLSVLASMEASSGQAGANWRQAEALLAGRGLARAARRSLRRGPTDLAASSAQEFANRLELGAVLLSLVPLHPPAPADPAFPWASGFSAPRLTAILITGDGIEPAIIDLGDFAEAAIVVRRWSRDIAIGRAAGTPGILHPLVGWLRNVGEIFVLAEGVFELVPIRLLAPESVVHHITDLRKGRAQGISTAPLLLVASDMFDDSFAPATNREVALVRAKLPDTKLHITTRDGIAGTLALLAVAPRHIHIIAHGTAVLDPRATELDVYVGAALELASELLTASHVADLCLEGVELVILSSCDTSAGAAQLAEGLASMAAAFLDAGAAAVIATLWPVLHEDTAAFMELLYEQNLSQPAIALAKAQRRAEAMGLGRACWAAWVTHEVAPDG